MKPGSGGDLAIDEKYDDEKRRLGRVMEVGFVIIALANAAAIVGRGLENFFRRDRERMDTVERVNWLES